MSGRTTRTSPRVGGTPLPRTAGRGEGGRAGGEGGGAGAAARAAARLPAAGASAVQISAASAPTATLLPNALSSAWLPSTARYQRSENAAIGKPVISESLNDSTMMITSGA